MKKFIAASFALSLVGCPLTNGPPSVTPTPTPTPKSELKGIEAMCAHLNKLGCEEGGAVYNDNLPGPKDVPNQSCSDFYKEVESEGIPVNATCVSKVPSCDLIETYRLKRENACK